MAVCTCAETQGHGADCKSVGSRAVEETRASHHHTPSLGQQTDREQALLTTNRKLIGNYFDIQFIISSLTDMTNALLPESLQKARFFASLQLKNVLSL